MDRAEAICYLSPIAESATLPRYKDALDTAIAALREQEQSKWISVKERLPEYGARVLVYDNMDDRNYMGIWSLETDRDDGSDCWEDEGGWWQPLAEVTHWMPLPEPPKDHFRDPTKMMGGADHE